MIHTNQPVSCFEAFATENNSVSKAFFLPEIQQSGRKPRVALVATIAWTIWNYRLSLIHWLEAAGYEVVIIAGEDEAVDKIKSLENLTFYSTGKFNRATFSLAANARLLARLYARMREARPDIVLLFTIRPNVLGNLAAATLGIPAISTVEGLGITGSKNSGWKGTLSRILYRIAFRKVQKVVFLNSDDLHEFKALRILPQTKAVTVPGPGVDVEHFSRGITPSGSSSCVFLFSGRLLIQKGIREFVKAAEILLSKGLPAEFWVLGAVDPGNPDSILEEEINEAAQKSIIRYWGFLDDVRPVIGQSDVLVLPSWYREGVPRSVLEAMAMEKPIITTDNVGCRETVENGINGMLVRPENVPDLVCAMENMMMLGPEKRRKMGIASRRKAVLEFADQIVLPDYLKLLESVLSPASPGK